MLLIYDKYLNVVTILVIRRIPVQPVHYEHLGVHGIKDWSSTLNRIYNLKNVINVILTIAGSDVNTTISK